MFHFLLYALSKKIEKIKLLKIAIANPIPTLSNNIITINITIALRKLAKFFLPASLLRISLFINDASSYLVNIHWFLNTSLHYLSINNKNFTLKLLSHIHIFFIQNNNEKLFLIYCAFFFSINIFMLKY